MLQKRVLFSVRGQRLGRRQLGIGNVPERAYALLGQGRCRLALGDVGSEAPLTEARDLFASMGYKQPALAETEELRAGAVATTG